MSDNLGEQFEAVALPVGTIFRVHSLPEQLGKIGLQKLHKSEQIFHQTGIESNNRRFSVPYSQKSWTYLEGLFSCFQV